MPDEPTGRSHLTPPKHRDIETLLVRPPAPLRCGGCVGRVGMFWLEQAHASQPPVVIDALDRVPVQFEFGHDGGWKVNPTGVQLGKSDRLVGGLAQALEQPLLLGVSKQASSTDCHPPVGLWACRAALTWAGNPTRLTPPQRRAQTKPPPR